MSKNKHKINWLTTLFLSIVPLVGVIGTILLCAFGLTSWPTWVLTAGIACMVGLSITGGYHRTFSHKSCSLSAPVRIIFLLFGAAAFQGSVLEWCTDHRNHHRYTDGDQDPYSISKGFWHAHFTWLIKLDPTKRDFSNVEDLKRDPLVRFQHKFFIPLSILVGFGLPIAIASLWGDALGGFIIAGALRITFNHHTTFAINSVCHKFGKKLYCEKQTAVDNWFTALFTFGEGYHNFHHRFPLDYRNGIRAYHFDPTKWLLKGLSYLGLARDLKQVSEHRIIRQRVLMKEKELQQRLSNQTNSEPHEQWQNLVSSVKQGTQQILTKIEQLEISYKELVRNQTKSSRRLIKQQRRLLKSAYSELKSYLSLWDRLQRHPLHVATLPSN